MQNLYISDNADHADIPRNKYIKMNLKKTNTAPSRFKLQQQMQQNQQNRRAPVKRFSDDDEEDDERICEIDKKIEMRKKMLAEEKAQNDPSQYFTNRYSYGNLIMYLLNQPGFFDFIYDICNMIIYFPPEMTFH